MLWKDTGIGARFLGLINEDGTVKRPSDDVKKQEHKTFDNYKELSKEINRRKYENIYGLKAKITKTR